MAKSFTIKGIIKFIDDKASETIKKVDDRVSMLKKNTDRIGKGIDQTGRGMMVVGAAGTAVAGGFGLAIKQAVDFEQAMADVNAVNELTDAQFNRLTQTALKLGAETVFSSTEAANAMVELTKAGLTVDQTISAIPGVLSAAAAEGMNLAQAAEIVVGVLQGQNLAMDQSTRVSDVLAKAANATAAGIIDLGEGFRYANTLSAQGLLTFEDTAAALGMLSNAGLKGTIAGTSLVAMFNQITKPSRDVQQAFGGMNNMIKIFTDESTGKLRDLPELIEIIGQAADQQGNDLMKMAFLSDFVGVEGAKAFSALRRSVTAKDAQGRPMFQGLRTDLQNAAGAAEDMAKKRLNSLKGALTIIGSALQNVGILIGGEFLGPLREGAESFKKFAGDSANILIALRKSANELTSEEHDLIKSPLGQFIIGFKEGLVEAIDTAKSAIKGIQATLQQWGIGVQGTEKDLGRMIAKIALAAAVIGPLLVGLAGMGFLFTQLSGLIVGPINIIRGFVGLGWNLIKMLQYVPTVLGVVAKGFGLLKVAGLAAIKGLASGMVWLVTNPIGWVILGVTGLVAAGYLLWKNWDSIWAGIKSVTTAAVDYLVGTFSYLTDWLKQASWGEIIAKTLLFPLRAAMTPLMEMVQWLLNSKIAQKLLGEGNVNALKSMAQAVSLMPTGEEIDQTRVAQPQSATIGARELSAQRVESQRVSQPTSASEPTNVTVEQAPINLTIENITKLDGKELSRNMSKQSIENSERAGMNAINPKNRQLMKQGQFATGFAR